MKKPRKNICKLVKEVGKFPPDAFAFVQEGLSYAVQDTHGEMSEAQRAIHEFMFNNDLDLGQLEGLHEEGRLPPEVRELIEQAGGFEELNRHVSGQCLCWGLRDYALQRWGALASAVLGHWNIRRTRDFGEIVFALVENNFLQKQPQDRIEDFDEVFDFQEALDRFFRIEVQAQADPVSTSDN